MPAWYRFPAPIVFDVSGRDALRYLNARLTNDIRSVKKGELIRAAQLSPQGRPEGFFTVLGRTEITPREGGTYTLLCDGGNQEDVLSAFKRYIVADRVTVNDCTGAATLILLFDTTFCEVQSLLSLKASGAERRGVFLEDNGRLGWISMRGAAHDSREGAGSPDSGSDPFAIEVLALGASGQDTTTILRSRLGEPLTEAEFTLLRLRRGVPLFPKEIAPTRAFLEASQKDAISFRKGCYVGQEVMEKIDAFGSTPRQLVRLRIDGLVADAEGSSVQDRSAESEELGKVISAAVDRQEGVTWGLTFIRSSRSQAGTEVTVKGARGVLLPVG